MTISDLPASDQRWVLCPGCRAIVYRGRWDRGLGTCPECGLHGRLTARERVATLLDPGSTEWLDFECEDADVLQFTDTMPYPDRLAQARARTGLDEAVICARGRIDGAPLVMAVMDFGFLGGSLGAVAGERIVRAAETAIDDHVPFLVATASGGARSGGAPPGAAHRTRTAAGEPLPSAQAAGPAAGQPGRQGPGPAARRRSVGAGARGQGPEPPDGQGLPQPDLLRVRRAARRPGRRRLRSHGGRDGPTLAWSAA